MHVHHSPVQSGMDLTLRVPCDMYWIMICLFRRHVASLCIGHFRVPSHFLLAHCEKWLFLYKTLSHWYSLSPIPDVYQFLSACFQT